MPQISLRFTCTRIVAIGTFWPLLRLTALTAQSIPPRLKLDDAVRPLRYDVDLTVIPGERSFSGSVNIAVRLIQPSAVVWLNATSLVFDEAMVRTHDHSYAAVVESGAQGFVALRLPNLIPAGIATLHIRYKGEIVSGGRGGVIESPDSGNAYVTTNFEPTDARRAFPCFDQPNFRTPWQLTLHVRNEQSAFSNAPQQSSVAEPNHMKAIRFKETRPLPTYLVAFAVGPFEVVDAGAAGKNHTPLRIIVPKGKTEQARYAAEVTGFLLERLEEYFGIPYPFEKLDSVSVPLAGGNMENAGLITYSQTAILSDPKIDSDLRRRRYAITAAHEMAHQWFGDLVTMFWWDDTWLNEAFATWMASRIIGSWKPDWNSRLDDLNGKFGAIDEDKLASTRRIRQPIESISDIPSAFDAITYQKGAAVIRMFETWAGETPFREGVRRYLTQHAFGNATESDFLAALSSTTERDLTEAFSTFTNQPGVPMIAGEVHCGSTPALDLRQTRYLDLGLEAAEGQKWDIPVCLRYPGGSGSVKECVLLKDTEATFPLTKARVCPAWLVLNAEAAGYYISKQTSAMLMALLNHLNELSAVERKSLLGDLEYLSNTGAVKTSEMLETLPAFANDPEGQIAGEAVYAAGMVEPLVRDSLTPNYARFIRSLFGARAQALGWNARAGDDPETKLLRTAIVPFVAADGQDSVLARQAQALADRWLNDHTGVDRDMIDGVLSVAAASGDRAFFDRLLNELANTSDEGQRRSLLHALGCFRDPKLAEASLDLLLDSKIDIRESQPLLETVAFSERYRETGRLPFEFVRKNFNELKRRLPSGGPVGDPGASLVFVGRYFCDEQSRNRFVDFFGERVKQFNGGQQNYSQVLEMIKTCEAHRAAQAPEVSAYLSQR
jgi:cytosol alanyl aminopeptidase